MRALYYPEAEPSLKWLRTFALFYDCVGSIVPEDWKSDLSSEIQEFGAHFPDSYQALPPRSRGEYLFSLSAKRLELTLNAVGAMPPAQLEVVIDDRGTTIPGYVFLHRDKLPPDLMALLVDRRLLLEGLPDPDSDVFAVEERAANLILAHIASEVAARTGWSTSTDRDIEFYFTSIHRLHRETRPDVTQQFLASAVLMSQVPRDILGISWRRYKEIRNAYADIRRPLEQLLSNLTRQEGLSRIGDAKLFQEALTGICGDFNREVEKFGKSRLWRSLERTAPVALATLMSAAAGVVGAVSPKNANWVVGLTIGSVIVQAYQVAVAPPADGYPANIYQTMADMKRDILQPGRLVSLF